MYTIIKTLNGKYHCQFRLQDGTEYYEETNLEDAIRHAKDFAWVMNHMKIKKKDICFLQEEVVTTKVLTNWKP